MLSPEYKILIKTCENLKDFLLEGATSNSQINIEKTNIQASPIPLPLSAEKGHFSSVTFIYDLHL